MAGGTTEILAGVAAVLRYDDIPEPTRACTKGLLLAALCLPALPAGAQQASPARGPQPPPAAPARPTAVSWKC